MKRILAFILCLILVFSLCACGIKPGETGETPNFTEAPAVTLPDGSTVYSKEPFVEFPQTGEYKETALLTNVPGQGVPLLLDMREDGTIDYIFGSTDRAYVMQSFAGNGVQYYTIAPDGTVQRHSNDWIAQIDNYLDMTNTAANIDDGRWHFIFAAENGTVLILAQFGPNRYTSDWSFMHTVLFKLVDDQVTIVPIDYHIDWNEKPVDWSTAHITDLRLEHGFVFFENRSLNAPVLNGDEFAYAAYRLNGILSDMTTYRKLTEYFTNQPDTIDDITVDPNGKLCVESIYWPRPFFYTENDSLYNLGKNGNTVMTTFETPGEDFCCWFDDAGQGILMRYDYNPEGAIDPEVLTVWSLEPLDLIETAVAHWNHTHASPIFRYETAAEEIENSNLTEEEILTRLNLELLNNQGPDVMILDGLDVDNYMEFMVPLDQVDTDGVYQSILDRFTVNEDLLALPARVVPYLLGRLTEGTHKIESLEAFADLVTTATGVLQVPNIYILELYSNHVYGTALYYVYHFDQVFRQWYPAWADAIWENGQLNKEVFVEFMTHTTRLVDHYTLQEYDPQQNLKPGAEAEEWPDNTFYPIMDETDFLDKKNHALYTLTAPGYVGLETYWKVDPGYRTPSKIIPHYIESIPGPDGSGVMIPMVITGVRAGGHEEEGLEFVQSLLSKEMQLSGAYDFLYYSSSRTGYPVIWDIRKTSSNIPKG